MIKVGLCGKIASGKSIAEKYLQEKGYLVIDLDIISHSLLEENEEVKTQILKEFQTLNRKEIGKIVFSDNSKKKTLENIIHPKLKEFIFDLFEKEKQEKMIFISGALLFQTGFNKFFNKTIFIDSNEDLRLERLIKRNNLSIEEAQKRINSQKDDLEKEADFIVENNDTIKNLKEKIDLILEKLSN